MCRQCASWTAFHSPFPARNKVSQLGHNGCMHSSDGSRAIAWQEGFGRLGSAFLTHLQPTPLPNAQWVARSPEVANLAGLPDGFLYTDAALQAFTGNTVLPGSQPYASVYSGHQFGVWAGQLGDGRAIHLGETAAGWELQLKGAGRTPYSRGGDGRAVLRSSIREFLCSEAMHALGIPTTRALCLTASDGPVYREEAETAAVVTRAAPSFVRFGHFEHFAARDMQHELRQLADYVIDRYYPACRNGWQSGSASTGNAYAALLYEVGQRTAQMVAHWQAVGFCHGVMNTDNMSILGLTIDYGPFQFLLSAQTGKAPDAHAMLSTNPAFVLRNHVGELAIRAAQAGDFSMVQSLQQVLSQPFVDHPAHSAWADFPPDWASSIAISCSS
jgi:uncharacterized protein YdiU (UPF0061 family)